MAGSVAELATSQNDAKYASLAQSFFQPVALETLDSTALPHQISDMRRIGD